MLKLEKNKVYKIYHNPNLFEEAFPRDYLLISPKSDVVYENFNIKFMCNFICCFDYDIVYDEITTVTSDCRCEPLNFKDLEEIKKAVEGSNGRYYYNRKLGMIIENDTKERSN